MPLTKCLIIQIKVKEKGLMEHIDANNSLLHIFNVVLLFTVQVNILAICVSFPQLQKIMSK